MKFKDEINFYVASGKSGNGMISFNNNYPDGGCGGKGGSVYLRASSKIYNFNHLKYMFFYKAEDGENGGRNKKTGKNGKNLYIDVPIGTSVFDCKKNLFLGDLIKSNDNIKIVSSGRVGYGNSILKNKKKFFIGEKSNIKLIYLEMKIFSDIGFLGFPNVGKSLFLNKSTNVISKSSDYNYTTLNPILGTSKFFQNIRLVLSDMPGIFSFASNGFGIGFKFLKHLLRSKILFHFFSYSSFYCKFNFFLNIFIINKEIYSFSSLFLKKKKCIIFNKIDIYFDIFYFSLYGKILNKHPNYFFFLISSKYNKGFKKLFFNLNELFLKGV